MQHFKNLKTVNSKKWNSLTISEKIDGYRFGIISDENQKLTFLKRNNKQITDIDSAFFPSYGRVIHYIENLVKKKNYVFVPNELYGFEILDSIVKDEFGNTKTNAKILMCIQTEGPILNSPFMQVPKLKIEDRILEFEERLKNGNEKENYVFLISEFGKKLLTKQCEGFVLNVDVNISKKLENINDKSKIITKIINKEKCFTFKVVDPTFTEKSILNAQKIRGIESQVSNSGIQLLEAFAKEHISMEPVEFGINFYDNLYAIEKNSEFKDEIDIYGIKLTESLKNVPTEILKDKRLSLMFKSCVLFKRSFDKLFSKTTEEN